MNAPIAPERALVDARPIDRSELGRLELAIQRLEAILLRSPGAETSPSDLRRLFCALCLTSGVNFPLRRIAAALSLAPEDAGKSATGAVQDRPMDERDVVRAMANLGFYARRKGHVPWQKVSTEIGPVLFVPSRRGGPNGSPQPVVLFSCPDTGRLRMIRATAPSEDVTPESGLARGTAWTFTQGEEHQLGKAQRSYTGNSWFAALLATFPGAAAALILVSAAAAIVAVLLPIFTIQTYAQVISLGSAEPMPGFLVGMLLVILIEGALLTWRKQILVFLANRIEYLIGTLSFERLLKIRASISERAAVTDQAARLRTVENIREFVTGPAAVSILEAPASLVAVAVIAILAGPVALVPLVAIAGHLLIFGLVRRHARVMTNIAADESTEMQRMTIETFEKREAIREAGLQHLWSKRMIVCARRQQRAQTRLRMVGSLAEALSAFVLTAGTILTMSAGAQAVWSGVIGAGGLLAITILGMRALTPFHTLCLSVQRFEQTRNSVVQINQLMDMQPEQEEPRPYTEMKTLNGAVSFLNLGFRAADTRPVFVGLDLEIEPGDRIALTGANGTGKTTILKAVMGLCELSLGALRIDGTDLRQLPLGDLRRRVAYVPQTPRIFPYTLRENLSFAAPMAGPEKIAYAIREAGLEEMVANLAGGLNHPLGAAEIAALPTDLVFRVAIAQALLVDSTLLLIDEIPNQLLDGPVGDIVRRLISSTNRRRTVIYVSHRSDFIELAQRVVALRYGKVPVITTPAKLLGRLPA